MILRLSDIMRGFCPSMNDVQKGTLLDSFYTTESGMVILISLVRICSPIGLRTISVTSISDTKTLLLTNQFWRKQYTSTRFLSTIFERSLTFKVMLRSR